MQNNLIFWRASNPVFLICSFLLIGIFFFKATSQYWPILSQSSILFIVVTSLLVLWICNQISVTQKQIQFLPAIVLIIWGACIGQFNIVSSILDDITSTSYINVLRQYLMNKIDLSFTSQTSNEFAKTLLFGTKSYMDQGLKSAYRTLGILHIIAISGMHLDILFKLLEKTTSWLPQANWARWIKLITLLTIVWTYTCIAYAGPSVVRASVFFSAILLGRFFHRNLFSFNTISVGILLVLLYNSHIISAIGLQLSYAAVIGIHFFYKPIAGLVPMDNKILKNIWDNLAVSIAAQLTTLPILLYYFHTSSSLSIIGNFIFVPASSILLYGLLVFLVLPNFAGIPQIIARYLSWYIEKMNGMIQLLFQSLHAGADRQYNMDITGLAYYYFCLFVVYYWIQNKTPNSLLILLTGTCLYSLLKLFSI
jgi:competence protein ComEC